MTSRFGIGGRLETWQTRRTHPEIQAAAREIAQAARPLGERLRALRLFAELQQQDVVRALRAPQDFASNVERGRRILTDDERAALAELFGVPPAVLSDTPSNATG